MDKRRVGFLVFLSFSLFLFPASQPSYASSGTEGAAFLDIPVGGGPAALGAAYTALANDAYASTWNPGGLGFLESTQFSAQHLSYLESIHYEYLSFAVPLPRSASCRSAECPSSALGGSIQYLGTGDMAGINNAGVPTGDFSSYYAAYNLAYGRSFNNKLSIGLTGKMINAKLDDVSANAFAADLGTMYRLDTKLSLAATLTNLGSELKFVDEGDSLPMAIHLGAAYRPSSRWLVTTEGVIPKAGLASFHIGGEWRPLEMLALRAGYRTDTLKGLSTMAGYTAGLGLNLWGHELAYAWIPYGDLGTTHYISLLMKFGEAGKRNLIQHQTIKKHRMAKPGKADDAVGGEPEYQQLIDLMKEGDDRLAKDGHKLPSK